MCDKLFSARETSQFKPGLNKGRFLGKQLWGGFAGPKERGQGSRHEAGDRGERGEKERKSMRMHAGSERMQRGGREGEQEAKMSGLHRKELLGEGKPSPWAVKFRLERERGQPWSAVV